MKLSAMRSVWPILPLTLLGGCALGKQDTLFGGSVNPVGGSCDPPSRATLSLRHRHIEFAPSSGVLVLVGALTPDGTLEASLVRPGIDRAPYRLELRARLAGDTIAGDYLTPRCHYAVRLTRTG